MSANTLRSSLTLLLSAMILAGCANYSGLDTEGQRLDAKSLKTAQSLDGVTLSPAAWPKSDWWSSLGDPQLDDLIREALHDSPDMQIAAARAHQASAAAYAAEQRQYRVKSDRVTRATAIRFALESGLDFEKGGEVSKTLARMYAGARRTIVNASIGEDPGPFRSTADTLDEIATAWRTASGG